MTLLAPVFLFGGIAAAALVVVAHFITRHRPPRTPLPTARFVPESAVQITARSYRLSDRGLLALRALVPLAAGAALSAPVITSPARPLARVVLADVSHHVASVDEVRDSVLGLVRDGDVVIAFDSIAHPPHLIGGDSLPDFATSRSGGSLSAALAAGLRAAARLRGVADSVELVIVSPLAAGQVDAATLELRAVHPGRLRHIPIAGAAAEVLGAPTVEVRADAADPLLASLDLLGVARPSGAAAPGHPGYEVRLVRAMPSAEDSVWMNAPGRMRVLVHWPAAPGADDAVQSEVDSAHALVTERGALVATLMRDRNVAMAAGARTIARWGDGSPAAAEQFLPGSASCLRQVGVVAPAVGDLVLRPAFLAFVSAMFAPCGGARDHAPAAPELVREIVGDGPLLATSALGRETDRSPLAPWLLGVALLAALAELVVRRRSA